MVRRSLGCVSSFSRARGWKHCRESARGGSSAREQWQIGAQRGRGWSGKVLEVRRAGARMGLGSVQGTRRRRCTLLRDSPLFGNGQGSGILIRRILGFPHRPSLRGGHLYHRGEAPGGAHGSVGRLRHGWGGCAVHRAFHSSYRYCLCWINPIERAIEWLCNQRRRDWARDARHSGSRGDCGD